MVVHAILESDRENGVRFDAIWKFIKSHFGLENERRKLVRATVDEALETGELIEDGNKIRVNFAKKKDEEEAEEEEVPEEETKASKKRRTKRPAMKKGTKTDEIEEDVEVEAEPETPRRGRKRAREASPSPSPKKRGRAAKRAKTEDASDVTETPRRRGRPAKNKQNKPAEDEHDDDAEEVVEATPKRRGRPPSKKGKSPQRGRSASPAKKKTKTTPSKQKSSPSKSPNKKHKHSPSKSKGELDLPKGWRVEEVVRKGGRTKGHADQYWYSPEGVKFRSRIAVLKHLEEQQ